MNARRRTILLATAGVAVFGLAVAAVDRALSDKGLSFETVRREDLAIGAEVRGSLFAVETDTLSPPQLQNVWRYQISSLATEGSEVKKGDVVIGFDSNEQSRELQEQEAERDSVQKKIEKRRADLKLERDNETLALEEARASLRKAELKLETPSSVISIAELQTARADHEIARQQIIHLETRLKAIANAAAEELELLARQLERAERRIRDLRFAIDAMAVKAPRDGIVVMVEGWEGEKKKVGDTAWRGQPIMEIPNLSRMKARGEVDEAEAGRLALGQRVSLRLDAQPDLELSGKIDVLAEGVRSESPTVPLKVLPIEIVLDRVDPALMKPGMRFRGTVEYERVPNAVVVPLEAVFDSPTGPLVRRRGIWGIGPVKVQLGKRNREKVEVLAGLDAGDRVVVSRENASEEAR
ncbi:MAG: efflux RND transporter periplasmic adaptor subunit [Thermoanaerobaculia bacterium]